MVVAVRHSPLTHLNRLFSSAGQSTWFVISGSLVRIRQEAQKFFFSCCCSSGVEHFLGKEEVSGSNPDNSSKDSLHGLSFLFTTTLYHNYLQHKSLTLYKERNSNVLFHFLRLWIKNGRESGISGVFGACVLPIVLPVLSPIFCHNVCFNVLKRYSSHSQHGGFLSYLSISTWLLVNVDKEISSLFTKGSLR